MARSAVSLFVVRAGQGDDLLPQIDPLIYSVVYDEDMKANIFGRGKGRYNKGPFSRSFVVSDRVFCGIRFFRKLLLQ